MTFPEALAALRPLAIRQRTDHGERVGFLMADATRALGGLTQASGSLTILLIEGLVDSEPVVIGDDVHTLYTLTDAAAPALH
jgi:hypothetical protein